MCFTCHLPLGPVVYLSPPSRPYLEGDVSPLVTTYSFHPPSIVPAPKKNGSRYTKNHFVCFLLSLSLSLFPLPPPSLVYPPTSPSRVSQFPIRASCFFVYDFVAD